jgi:rubrerythrin
MSYTTQHGQPQGTTRLFTNKLREALIAEIIAINGYEQHIANSNMEYINQAWSKIMADEKRHYGIFLKLLREYDPEEYKAYVEHAEISVPSLPMQAYTPDYNKQLILNNIRYDIKGEFEASILYEDLAALIPYPDIRGTLIMISNEEKGHVDHLTRLLLDYGPGQYGYLE